VDHHAGDVGPFAELPYEREDGVLGGVGPELVEAVSDAEALALCALVLGVLSGGVVAEVDEDGVEGGFCSAGAEAFDAACDRASFAF